MGEQCERQLVLLVAERTGYFLEKRFIASVFVRDPLQTRGFLSETESRRRFENTRRALFGDFAERRETTTWFGQRHVRAERVGKFCRVDAHLQHVAVIARAREELPRGGIDENVQDRAVKRRIRRVAVPFPAAVGELEFDAAADRLGAINANCRVAEIRPGSRFQTPNWTISICSPPMARKVEPKSPANQRACNSSSEQVRGVTSNGRSRTRAAARNSP